MIKNSSSFFLWFFGFHKYSVDKKKSSIIELKGQSNEIFDPHFSSFEPAQATDQWVKIFSILVKILPSYSNFLLKSPWRVILRRAYLLGVSYCAESLMTPGSQQPFLPTFVQASVTKINVVHNFIFYFKKSCIFKKSSSIKTNFTPRGLIRYLWKQCWRGGAEIF